MFEPAQDLSKPLSHPCYVSVTSDVPRSSVVCLHCFLTERGRSRDQVVIDDPPSRQAAPARPDRELTPRELGHRWRMLTHLRRSYGR